MDHKETYCADLSHPCHYNVEYHEQVTATPQHTQEEANELVSLIDQFCDYTPYYVPLKEVAA